MRKIFTFILALIAGAGTMFAQYSYSGVCGNNLQWNLTDGTLTITGSGEMTNYLKTDAPWYAYRDYIERLDLSKDMTTIGNAAFYRCSALTSVNIPSGVTYIGGNAFYCCYALENVTIPNSVKTIAGYAFRECYSLTSVDVPDGVTTVGEDAFTFVPNVVYHGTLDGAPWGAYSLNGYIDGFLVYSDATKTNLLACSAAATGEITIPNSITSIGKDLFSMCSGITAVNIPNTVTSIGAGAFYYCSSLTGITIPDGITTIEESTFYYCSALKNVNIPNSVTTINMYAFRYCTALENINLPNGLTTIGESAFGFCDALKTITLPYSLTKIDTEAFWKCTALTSITCEAATPPACKSYAFEWVPKSIPVYVPKESIDAYSEAENWKKFTDFRPIQAAEADVTGIKVELGEYSAVISWPAVAGAKVYTIQVSKGEQLVCTLTFNESGQLENIAFNAPSRNGGDYSQVRAATQTATGWQYTIDGLEAGTAYNLTITAKNEAEQEIDKKNLTFQTEGGTTTGIDQISQEPTAKSQKLIKDGQLLILRDGKVYTVDGLIVR
jgi:hypothetical protein